MPVPESPRSRSIKTFEGLFNCHRITFQDVSFMEDARKLMLSDDRLNNFYLCSLVNEIRFQGSCPNCASPLRLERWNWTLIFANKASPWRKLDLRVLFQTWAVIFISTLVLVLFFVYIHVLNSCFIETVCYNLQNVRYGTLDYSWYR